MTLESREFEEARNDGIDPLERPAVLCLVVTPEGAFKLLERDVLNDGIGRFSEVGGALDTAVDPLIDSEACERLGRGN